MVSSSENDAASQQQHEVDIPAGQESKTFLTGTPSQNKMLTPSVPGRQRGSSIRTLTLRPSSGQLADCLRLSPVTKCCKKLWPHRDGSPMVGTRFRSKGPIREVWGFI